MTLSSPQPGAWLLTIESMARRLVNTTLKNQKDTFRFELWDMDSSSVDLDYVVEFDVAGFTIDWKGSDKDSPLMSSTMEWTMYLNETHRSAIMPVVFAAEEFRLCVRVMKGSNVFWCGIVHPEGTSEEITDGISTVSLQASDGLGILENINWVQSDGERYSGSMKVRDALWNALGKLPHTSLIASTGGAVLVEHQLNQPITGNTGSYPNEFLYTFSNNTRGVMDYMELNPNTFYYSNIEEERVVMGQKFMSMDKFNPDDFASSKLVVQDIMAALGATICFADGKWHVFDKTAQFMCDNDEEYDLIEWNVTQSNTLDTSANLVTATYNPNLYDKNATVNEGSTLYVNRPRFDFLRGIARKAAFAVRAVTQKHVRAGSDLLYANGIGYHDSKQRPVWETGAGFETPLLDMFRVSRSASADKDEVAYEGPFFDGDNSWDGLFDTRNRERTIVDLQIPNGDNDGQVRIHISGNVSYTNRNITGSPATWGSLGIYKQRFEVYDGSNWYRLSRPVRTLAYSSNGTPFSITITGSGNNAYFPKVWQGTYEWIEDTDARYDDAWLDIPLGANNSVVEQGVVSKFMQTDYPNLDTYTPPLTKLSGTADNILAKDPERNHYVWRHDYVYDMPSDSSTIEKIRIQNPVLEEWDQLTGPNLIYLSDGSAGELGDNYFSPSYRTKSNDSATDGEGTKPNSMTGFELSGVEVMFGDGSKEFDQVCVSYPTTAQGKQILNLNGTRLGASFVNTGNSTHGRFTASDYVSPNNQEDNLKFQRPYDQSFQKESLSELVTSNFLNLRGRVRETVNGASIHGYDTGHDNVSQIMFPWNRLVTDKLDSTTKIIIPYEINYTLNEGRQEFEAWFRNYSAEANIGSTTEVENDSTRGPNPPIGNMEKPSGADLSDFVQSEATSDTGGGGLDKDEIELLQTFLEK